MGGRGEESDRVHEEELNDSCGQRSFAKDGVGLDVEGKSGRISFEKPGLEIVDDGREERGRGRGDGGVRRTTVMQEERAASFTKKKAEATNYNDGPSNPARDKILDENLIGDRPIAEAKAPVVEAPKPESTPKVEPPEVTEVSVGSRGRKPS